MNQSYGKLLSEVSFINKNMQLISSQLVTYYFFGSFNWEGSWNERK